MARVEPCKIRELHLDVFSEETDKLDDSCMFFKGYIYVPGMV